ncbi:MAG: leucine-rich repeat protein [Lachnospiraceae bacterium]|nr:leucine-rich repeat protein [Lachnospiraceae bacterium]
MKLVIAIMAVIIVALTIGVILLLPKSGTAKKVAKQLSLGEKYLSELDYEQAIAAYKLAIELDPKCTDAYLELADIYSEKGEYDKAEEILEKARAAVNEEDLGRVDRKQEAVRKNKEEAEGTPEPTAAPLPTSEPTKTPTPEPTKSAGSKVKFTGKTVDIEVAGIGDSVIFGTYEQDNDLGNGAEAIEWLVLDKQDGKLLLLSKYALDCKKYNEEFVDITWETCTLRSWLRNEFYLTAFSEREKRYITESLLVNQDNPLRGTEGGKDTVDKVFLLSFDEVTTYFNPDPEAWDSIRCTKMTEYAKAQGGEPYNEAQMGEYGTTEYDGNGVWWLRSPGDQGVHVVCIGENGYISRNGAGVIYANGVVRPAVWIDIQAANATEILQPTATPKLTATPVPTPTIAPTVTPEPTPTAIPKPTAAPISTTSAEDFEWKENDDGTVTITDFKDLKATNIIVPAEINGKTVTIIGGNAFAYLYDLVSIVLPDTIRKIDRFAFFNCSSLIKIEIPNGVTEIEYRAFDGCNSLKSVFIPASLKKIGGYDGTNRYYGFYNWDCLSLEEYIVSDENEVFTSIDGSLYSKDGTTLFCVPCATKGSFRIPETVLLVQTYAFENCSGIKEIIVTGEETSVEASFRGCTSLERFVVEKPKTDYVSVDNTDYVTIDGALIIPGRFSSLVSVPAKGIGKVYEIPEIITRIRDDAFFNCVNMEKVVIPSNVRSYIDDETGTWSHNGYTYSTNQFNFFRTCKKLKEISVASESEWYTAESKVLFSKDKKVLVSMPCAYEKDTYSIPNGVEKIARYAFSNNERLESVTLPDSVNTICPGAFENCSNLTEVVFSKGIMTIGVSAFSGCNSLETVVLPEGLECIHDYAFYPCSNLKTIVVPASVTELGALVFGSGTTIITPSGSYAEQYAINNHIPVQNP